ncbi:MAG: hypothetical protein JNK14_07535 [Chitinophagaceae bacterium]|nr:hypothetical protein [Chitinophagaceae bacterium]
MILIPEAKITINGKEYGLLFGYSCYKLFASACFRYKDTYFTEGGELTGLAVIKLFHSAYVNYCYAKEHTPELTYDQIAEWADEQYATEDGQKIIGELLEKWASSKEVKKMQEEQEKKNQLTQGQENQTSMT